MPGYDTAAAVEVEVEGVAGAEVVAVAVVEGKGIVQAVGQIHRTVE